ncbi:salmochelin biosynthesis C-glycosyltransferase IroB [Kutzneria viridogrisea]
MGEIMKLLFTALPGSGLFLPTVPLAWAARAAGHEVLVINNGLGAGAAVGAGLPTVDVLPERDLWAEFMESVAGHVTPGDNDGGVTISGGFGWFGEQILEPALAVARGFAPDVVVSTLEQGAGPLIAGELGVSLVEQGIRLGWAGTGEHAVGTRKAILDRLEERRTWLGLAPPAAPSATIDVRPPSMGGLATDSQWLMRYVPYNETRLLPAWVTDRPSRPRVCLTLGSVLPQLGGLATLRDLLAALSTMDIEVLVAAGEVDLGPLPDNARALGWMPLGALMPTCSAIVHHGGSATTATPLAYGVPQLIIASFADQPLNAELAAKRGVAISIPPAEVTPELVRESLARLLREPGFARAANEVRDEIAAQPAPSSIVGRIEQVA